VMFMQPVVAAPNAGSAFKRCCGWFATTHSGLNLNSRQPRDHAGSTPRSQTSKMIGS
jgi:hypothetical protein